MNNKDQFKKPMTPWPALAPYGQTIYCSKLDLKLYYFSAGDIKKEKIILVHGLGDEADTWRHIILPLSEEYHVIALDLPGFGRSDQPYLDYTPEFMINAILCLMEELDFSSALFIGSSLGGMLTHMLSIKHPEKVNGLVLVGGAVSAKQDFNNKGLNLMRIPILGEFLYTRLRRNPIAAYKTLEEVYYNLERLPSDDQSFLFHRVNQRVWSDDQRRAYFSTLRQLISWLDHSKPELIEKLRPLNVPTLIIRGEYDTLFSNEAADYIRTEQPHVETANIEDSGHLPQQEKPEQFLNVLSNWLRKNI
jgi:pimeloyl-ACP methyl ester carboxylesterase